MTNEIGDIIKDKLSALTFIEKLAGVVKTITISGQDKDNRVYKQSFPVACNMSFEDCTNGSRYQDLVPNSKLKSIVYLEDQGIRKNGVNGANTVYVASFLLVGWLNLKKLGESSCSISGLVVASILKTLNVQPFNEGIYQRIRIEDLGQNPQSNIPFNKYSYDESKTQYLMYPFDYFSIPLQVTFELNTACVDDYVAKSALNCITK